MLVVTTSLPPAPADFDVVVLAASTGGIHALRTVIPALPATFPTPVLVVQHRGSDTPELLTQLLSRRAALPVRTAVGGPLERGVTVLPAGCTADLSPDGRLTPRPAPSGRTADGLLTAAAPPSAPGCWPSS